MLISHGVPLLGGRQTREGWGKQVIFELNGLISRQRGEIRPKLLLVANRKVHMHFRLAPRSMTLDDLELYKFEFSENFSECRADFGRNNS